MRISEDIVTIGQFKTHAAKMLRRVHESRRPLVITQRGVPAAVVLSPEEYDRLAYEREFIDAVADGLSDIEAGRVMSHEGPVDSSRQW